MNKKINTDHIANELKSSSFFLAGKNEEQVKSDVMTSQSDITTSEDDITPNPKSSETIQKEVQVPASKSNLDIEKLKTVIKSLSEIPTSAFTTPIRLSEQEKKDIEDFIYITIRKNGLQGYQVSISKLMRYCLRYLMKVHETELVQALKEALQKDTNLPI